METGFRQELSSQAPTSPVRHIDTSLSHHATASVPDTAEQDKAAAAQDEAINREQQRIVNELAARDREVRAHEAAHIFVGRQYVVSGPSYTYQQGPNGRNYAIGGEVQLDVSAEAEPRSTLSKAETVRRAALAPVEPSAQDRLVASRATQLAAQARVAIAAEQRNQHQTEQNPNQSTQPARDFHAGDQQEVSHQVNVYA